MPDMDGTEAMKRIRSSQNGKNRKTPIICLTADVISGARERYLKLGFDDYLTKPIDGIELEKMLIRYISADKVELTEVEENGNVDDEQLDGTLRAALLENGVDIRNGMTLCGNDVNIYRSILSAFATEEMTKSDNLRNYYETGDWSNYGICAHSIKGTARTIGAENLAGLAAESEAAAKKEDVQTIRKNHDTVLEMYTRLAAMIRDTAGTDEISDDEIIEFEAQ